MPFAVLSIVTNCCDNQIQKSKKTFIIPCCYYTEYNKSLNLSNAGTFNKLSLP